MDLRKEEDRNRVCGIYVSKDTILLPAQQTPVNVCITHRTPTDRAYVGILETEAIPSLTNVYSARSLIPAKFSGIQVPLLNTAKCCQVVTKGTELGILQAAEVIDDITEETGRKETERMLRPEEKEAVEKIMSGLPEDLDDCLLYTSPSPRDGLLSRMPSSA